MSATPDDGPMGLSPAFIILYGPSGLGKSTDCLWTASTTGVFIVAHPDGLVGVITTQKLALKASQVRIAQNLTAAYSHLLAIITSNQKGDTAYTFIVIDDLSMLMENELSDMKASGKYAAKGDNFSFLIWSDLMATLNTFGRVARWAGVHILANAHVREPGFDQKGVFSPGGPQVPQAKQVKKLPHIATEVLKVEHDPDVYLHPVHMRAEIDSSWEMKSRYGLNGTAPLNTGEWLRAQGHVIARPYPWIEEWVAVIAARIGEGKPAREVAKKALDLMISKGRSPEAAYWAVRDGVHRAIFRQIQATALISRV
jgi:hypothetical protein